MNNQLIRTVEKYQMLDCNDSVVVALSGGADSVALLDALISLKEKYNLTIYAAHINHGLRGLESERDESFCKILCENYKIKLFVKRANVREMAKAQKLSEELCGRNVRYSFLDETAKRFNAKIATAHTASDNAETLIFNLTRGAGINGAGGIAPVRSNIIRPLIEVTRSQVEQYCSNNKLEYVTDSTNLSDDYTRNRLRHRVIPNLKDQNPQFELAALHFSQFAREASQYLENQAAAALDECKTEFGYSCRRLLGYDEIITKTALAVLCKQNAKTTPEHKHIELLLDAVKNGGAVELSKVCTAVSKQGVLRFVNTNIQADSINIPLNNRVEISLKEKLYIAELNSFDVTENTFVFRFRKSGDVFSPQKRKITKSLRKLMNELKIPSELRDNLLVLADGSTILWCESIGFSSEGAALNKQNKLKIQVKNRGNNNA